MTQFEFIYKTKLSGAVTRQNPDGTTVAQLNPCVFIIHDSTQMNRMEIVFQFEEERRYIIPSHVELDELMILQQRKADLVDLSQYCDKYLTKT